jgi:hypothetical protein
VSGNLFLCKKIAERLKCVKVYLLIEAQNSANHEIICILHFAFIKYFRIQHRIKAYASFLQIWHQDQVLEIECKKIG